VTARVPVRSLVAVAVAVLMAAALLAVAAVEDSDAARRTCRAPGSATVVESSRGRVYRFVAREPSRTVTRTFVCLYRPKRKFLLHRDVQPSDGGGVFSYEYRLTSPFVAFVVAEDDPTSGEIVAADVRVVDGRTGRVRRRSAEIDGGGVGVTDLELTRTASVAWIDDTGAGGARQVQALDGSGQRVLDTGNVEPRSLRRSGNVVSWVKDGVTHSETLP
jgi:hypothetical protein